MSIQTQAGLTLRIAERLIKAEIEDATQNMADGLAIKSFEEYRQCVGRIQGLRSALVALGEAEVEASQR